MTEARIELNAASVQSGQSAEQLDAVNGELPRAIPKFIAHLFDFSL
jgi:hypothetical protein